MAIGNSPPASACFKIATVFLFLIFPLHMGGYVFPRWSSLEVSKKLWVVSVSGTYYSGLWLDCGCVGFVGCVCFPKIYNPGWLLAVRAMETLGFIGLIISAVLSIIIVCKRIQNKRIKLFNIVCAGGAGICIFIGLIVFGVENAEDFRLIYSFIESLPLDLDTTSSLSVSFGACTLAGIVCLFFCVPLLVRDYFKPVSPAVQESSVTVQQAQQGQISFAPPGQTHVLINTLSQQPFGHMPAYTYQQPSYVQPVQGMMASTALTSQPGYIQQGQGMQGAVTFTPGQEMQGLTAYTPQPDYEQPGQEKQGPPANTSQPVNVQPGEGMQGPPAYTQ